jgi:hypothetical protein
MALSIQFGIANTYALGVGFYVVGALIIVVSRRANAIDVSAATPANDLVRPDEAAYAADPGAPSIQPTEVELEANINTARSLRSTHLARTDEVL